MTQPKSNPAFIKFIQQEYQEIINHYLLVSILPENKDLLLKRIKERFSKNLFEFVLGQIAVLNSLFCAVTGGSKGKYAEEYYFLWKLNEEVFGEDGKEFCSECGMKLNEIERLDGQCKICRNKK